jgi:predicted TIM-barrel fold metal-dependent hydrolase
VAEVTDATGGRVIDFRVRLPNDRRPAVQVPTAVGERYDQVLGLGHTIERGADDLAGDMAAAGVSMVVVHAEYEYGDIADALNEGVAAYAADRPTDVLCGFGTVALDGLSVSRMVRQVRRLAALGLQGINLQPCFFGRAVDDAELYAVYAAAQEDGLVVAIHTGVGYNTLRPIDGEQPYRLDRVACAFPGLRLVACHAGWPWATELAAVMRKHPTVYADFGGMSPKYLGEPGTGWDTLFRYANSLLTDQMLFATDWPAFDPARALAEWRALPLKPGALQSLLGANALRLLGSTAGGHQAPGPTE